MRESLEAASRAVSPARRSQVGVDPGLVLLLLEAPTQPRLVLDPARDPVEAPDVPPVAWIVHHVVDRDAEGLEDRDERPARHDQLDRRRVQEGYRRQLRK